MPVYTIYHRPLLQGKPRVDLAKDLSKLHCSVTGAKIESVKVIFHQLDSYTFFSGGEDKHDYVCVVAQIRRGRSEELKLFLLRGMYELIKDAFAMKIEAQEIQTQIIEIDDERTVMTNGVLNT